MNGTTASDVNKKKQVMITRENSCDQILDLILGMPFIQNINGKKIPTI